MSQKTSVMTETGFTPGQLPVLSGHSTVNILVSKYLYFIFMIHNDEDHGST